jgi:Flp pilus assembly protein TadB
MAQTKKKRRSKHRGTAAGTISARGRTGRPPSAEERKKATRESIREQRLNRPPTWSSSAKRAALAAGFMFVFLFLTNKHKVAPAAVFAILALLLYIPAGYYMEVYLFRRRQLKKSAQK